MTTHQHYFNGVCENCRQHRIVTKTPDNRTLCSRCRFAAENAERGEKPVVEDERRD